MNCIDTDTTGEERKPFDTVYMRGFYEHGQALGRSGTFWTKHPQIRTKGAGGMQLSSSRQVE